MPLNGGPLTLPDDRKETALNGTRTAVKACQPFAVALKGAKKSAEVFPDRRLLAEPPRQALPPARRPASRWSPTSGGGRRPDAHQHEAGAEVTTTRLAVLPGGHTPWHYDPGAHVVAVTAENVTVYETDCSERGTFTRGRASSTPGQRSPATSTPSTTRDRTTPRCVAADDIVDRRHPARFPGALEGPLRRGPHVCRSRPARSERDRPARRRPGRLPRGMGGPEQPGRLLEPREEPASVAARPSRHSAVATRSPCRCQPSAEQLFSRAGVVFRSGQFVSQLPRRPGSFRPADGVDVVDGRRRSLHRSLLSDPWTHAVSHT